MGHFSLLQVIHNLDIIAAFFINQQTLLMVLSKNRSTLLLSKSLSHQLPCAATAVSSLGYIFDDLVSELLSLVFRQIDFFLSFG